MDYYLKHAAYWDTTADETYARWSKQDPWMERVVGLIEAMGGNSILDLGCGQGILYDRLPESLRAIYMGVDSSSGMLDVFRKRHPEATVFQRDIRTLDEPRADIVVCLNTLMYFSESLPEVLATMAKLVLPGGHALFTAPLEDGELGNTINEETLADSRLPVALRGPREENGRYVFVRPDFALMVVDAFKTASRFYFRDLKENKYWMIGVTL